MSQAIGDMASYLVTPIFTNPFGNGNLVTARGADRCGRGTKRFRAAIESRRFWFGVSHTLTALVRGITHTTSGYHTHLFGVSHTKGRGITHSKFGVSHMLLKIKIIKINDLYLLSTYEKIPLTFLSLITCNPEHQRHKIRPPSYG